MASLGPSTELTEGPTLLAVDINTDYYQMMLQQHSIMYTYMKSRLHGAEPHSHSCAGIVVSISDSMVPCRAQKPAQARCRAEVMMNKPHTCVESLLSRLDGC